MKRTFVLAHQGARDRASQYCQEAPDGYVVTFSEPTRTLEQNSLLWPLLTEVSRQVDWHGRRLTSGEWKEVFTAALKRQKVVPGIDGGFVVLGTSTSRMPKKDFSELLELIYAFGAEHGVTFKEPYGKV